jgi:WXG100 family type VII secretion target
MADRIRLTVSQAQQTASVFKNNSNELQTLLNKLTSTKNSLVADWEGDSSQAFSQEFDRLAQVVKQFVELINNTGIQVDNAGKEIQQTDTAVASSLRR